MVNCLVRVLATQRVGTPNSICRERRAMSAVAGNIRRASWWEAPWRSQNISTNLLGRVLRRKNTDAVRPIIKLRHNLTKPQNMLQPNYKVICCVATVGAARPHSNSPFTPGDLWTTSQGSYMKTIQDRPTAVFIITCVIRILYFECWGNVLFKRSEPLFLINFVNLLRSFIISQIQDEICNVHRTKWEMHAEF
jgi:hypothetical protein